MAWVLPRQNVWQFLAAPLNAIQKCFKKSRLNIWVELLGVFKASGENYRILGKIFSPVIFIKGHAITMLRIIWSLQSSEYESCFFKNVKKWKNIYKGQLISEWHFDVLKFPKKPSKIWWISALIWLNWENKGPFIIQSCQILSL